MILRSSDAENAYLCCNLSTLCVFLQEEIAVIIVVEELALYKNCCLEKLVLPHEIG